MVAPGKKLLVLDINGLLLDTYFQSESRPDRPHDAQVNRFYVYKRPFCEDFIQFCFENFIVGVWSSAREHNVLSLVEFMFKEAKEKLAFIWHQQHCTDAGIMHPENKFKPVFLKELSKLWEKTEPDLPWEDGDYGPSNTLLIDDSAYKAINNPDHTAIFPKTYKATDVEDNFLGGELRIYLEGLLKSKDVRSYLKRNPIGQPSIGLSDPLGLRSLVEAMSKPKQIPAHVLGTSAAVTPISIPSLSRRIPDSIPSYNHFIPVIPNPIPSFNEWIPAVPYVPPHQRIMANDFHTSPPRRDRDPQTRAFARGDNKWKRSDHDHTNQGSGDHFQRELAYHTVESGVGPSLPMSRETGQGPLRRSRNDHPSQVQSGGRLYETAHISGGGQIFDDNLRHQRFDPRRSCRGWSVETEDLNHGGSRTFHTDGARSQVDFHQVEGTKRRKRSDGTWNQEVDHRGEEGGRKRYRDEDEGRKRYRDEEGGRKRYRDEARAEEVTTHQGKRSRKRRDGLCMDEKNAIRPRIWSTAREYEEMHNCQHRTPQRYGRSKSRDSRDLQRLPDRQHSHRRDISENLNRPSHKIDDQSHDSNNSRRSKKKKNKSRV